MQPISLQTRYRSANENTIALWAKNAGIGNIREENYYDPLNRGINFGAVAGELMLAKTNYNWTKCYPLLPARI
ncbi:hypothetical protein ACX64R_20350 (plasmid) [Pantoea dispersa]